ncbi:hypothetical protein KCU73_g9743, partial [Aureobasidium melanogenum]
MANNFMLKLLIIFFGCLNFFGAVAQISKKPDAASSAVQDGGYQASTLLTSVINKVDIVPHDLDASNAQSQPAANTTDDLAEMNNDEVLSDAEEEDDDDESLELMDANVTDTGDVAMSSASKGGKRLKARLVRYHKAECEKKRHPRKGKKMKEGKCHRLDKNHFKSYEFCIGKQKKDKKGKDDDDDDDESDIPSGCRMMIFFDKKCKDEASSTNAEESCKDIGEEGVDDDDDDDDKDDRKLHARDLMGKKGKGPKYKSAKFLCDGVDTSENTKKTETEDDYYVTTSVSSQPIRVVDPTGSYSKSYTPSSITATRSTKSATCKTGSADTTATAVDEKDPDDDDDDDDEKEGDDKEDDDKEDDKEDDDEDKETSSTASQTTKTKKHKSKSHKSKTHTKSKKHHSKTRSISATQSAQATSDSQSP